MCYSKESSLNGFIFGITTSILLLNSTNNTSKHIGFIFANISLMQLLEYFIWNDQKCGKINEIASKLIVVALGLQTLSLFLGGYFFNTLNINKNLLLSIIVLIISMILYYIVTVFFFTTNINWCTKPSKDNYHLKWANSDKYMISTRILYYFSYLIVCLLGKDRLRFMLLLFILIFILIYSYVTIIKGSFYSKWCFYGAMIPIIFIFYDFFESFLST